MIRGHAMPFGAEVVADGRVRFRLWAPAARAVELVTNAGTAGNPMTPMEARYETVGGGMASTPRISIAPDPNDDKMYIKTSKGRVITIEPPPRDGSGSSIIYWKQNQ